MEPAVRFERIGKSYPGVRALTDVTLDVARGSCHAICGENGAGKSTLGKILGGIVAPDTGRLLVDGKAVRFAGPPDALLAGVGVVHQELSACENLSVAENLCLSRLPSARGFVRRGATLERAREMLAAVGADVDVGRVLGELPIAQRQLVQIAAAVGSGARILVLDEPTSSLGDDEARRLFDLIGRLKGDGVTFIYVSHRMPEIFRLCDTVTVLRDGALVATRPIGDVTEAELVRMMIGRPLGEARPRGAAVAGSPVLSVQGDVTFEVRAGEVVGLAGLVGSGRSETAHAIFGITPGAALSIHLRGAPVRFTSPAEAIANGIGLVPEDRKRQGLVMSESTIRNTSLPILRRLSRVRWLRRGEERDLVGKLLDRLRVRASAIDEPVGGLSGGNQQKVLIARWLAAGSSVLILDEPTRGVDVGAKAEIHDLIRQLAEAGTAVVLISSELPELIALSDRIVVLREGRSVGEVKGSEVDQEALLLMMTGAGSSKARR